MREDLKKCCKKLILLVIVLVMAAEVAGNYSLVAAADYNKYSNSKKSWYIMKHDKHKVSGGADKVMYICFDCGYEGGYTKGMLKV